jgi:hypothetical protein
MPPALTGRERTLVARPERCSPLADSSPPPPEAVVVEGVLRRAVPLGGAIRLDVDTTAGPVTAVTTAEIAHTPGDTIRLAIPCEHLRACDAE